MKITTTIAFIIFFFNLSYPQNDYKNQIDLSSGAFANSIFQFSGNTYIDNGKGYQFGILINRKLTKKLWFNSGIKYLTAFNYYTGSLTGCSADQEDRNIQYVIIKMPITLRYDIKNWLYIKPGISLDSDFSSYIQPAYYTGISVLISGGFDFRLSDQLHLNIEPAFNITPVIPFDFHKYRYQYKIFTAGLNFNVGFVF